VQNSCATKVGKGELEIIIKNTTDSSSDGLKSRDRDLATFSGITSLGTHLFTPVL